MVGTAVTVTGQKIPLPPEPRSLFKRARPSQEIISADYINSEEDFSHPRLWYVGGRCEVIKDFLPYLYWKLVHEDEENAVALAWKLGRERRAQVQHVEKVRLRDGAADADFIKIYCASTRGVVIMRNVGEELDGIEPREADMPFHLRYLIDTNRKVMTTLVGKRMISIDLETWNEGQMSNARKDPILLISVGWRFDGGVLNSLVIEGGTEPSEEARAINALNSLIREANPDIIVTYNGDEFDFPFLQTRAEKHGIELSWGRNGSELVRDRRGEWNVTGRAVIDLFRMATRDLQEYKDKKLKTLTDEMNLMRRDERAIIDPSKIAHYWRNERGHLLKYSGDDAKATILLAEKLLPTQYELCNFARSPLQDIAHGARSRVVELFKIATCRLSGIVYPNKKRRNYDEVTEDDDDNEDKYEGAVVFNPPAGRVENIRVKDCKSMYPNILVANNISPETVCYRDECDKEHHVTPDIEQACRDERCPLKHERVEEDGEEYTIHRVKHKFHTAKYGEGFIAGIARTLLAMREEIKKRLKKLEYGSAEYNLVDAEQHAVKVLANSLYGVMGWRVYRWYEVACAESITAFGRHYILTIAAEARALTIEVLAGDTDSVFLKEHPAIANLKTIVEAKIPVILEDEGLYPRGFFTGKKKRYVLLDSKGKLKERGLEIRRGDWCKAAKETQKFCVEAVLRTEDLEAAIKASVKYTQTVVAEIRAGTIPREKLVISKKLTVNPDSYKVPMPHAEAVKREVDKELWDSLIGQKVSYVIMKKAHRDAPDTQHSRTRTTQFLTEKEWQNLDKDYYVNMQVVTAAMRILSVFGISEDELLGRPKQVSLEGFV